MLAGLLCVGVSVFSLDGSHGATATGSTVTAATIVSATAAAPAERVLDDLGNAVILARPARRIVSLAPHATELLFAAGGGARIVGTVQYSDFPAAAKAIAQVGDSSRLDIERIIALQPDLVVAWPQASAQRALASLKQRGIAVFYSDPHRLDQIADSVERLGILLGTQPQATTSASALRRDLAALTTRYAQRPPVRVFYQIWDQPLLTLNGSNIVSDAIRVCGGQNIFAALPVSAPAVSIEAVLQQDPEVILGTGEHSPADGGVNMWKRYGVLTAVRRHNLMTIDGNLINRPGPRMIAGAAALCAALEQARAQRAN